jgi:predicted O-methyltransferase YrrM
MINDRERQEIVRLWQRKLDQDSAGLLQSQRHRNLEPDSAEFIHALVRGLHAKNILEIGGSSGLSTIALASAAREISGRLTSIEIEPERQLESRRTIQQLAVDPFVEFMNADAADILPNLAPSDFVLIDCEKDDYIRFFEMLKLSASATVVADNILSHNLGDYVAYVRSRGLQSVTLPIGKGLELTRIEASSQKRKSGTQ